MKSIYKTDNGEKIFLDLYNKKVKKLGIEYEDIFVNTSYGKTHILVTGNKKGKPLIFLHGGNSPTPYTLLYFLKLRDSNKIYAIDINGLPGKSSQTKIKNNKIEYGKWLDEVIKKIKLKQVNCMAVSFSGGILLSLAAFNPERIKKMILIVPSGFLFVSILKLVFDMGFPLLKYRLWPNRKNLILVIKSYGPIAQQDEDLLELCEATFNHLNMDIPSPVILKKNDLKNFNASTIIFSAEKDNLYPGKKLIKKAKKIIKNIEYAECITGATHYDVGTNDDVQTKIINSLKKWHLSESTQSSLHFLRIY